MTQLDTSAWTLRVDARLAEPDPALSRRQLRNRAVFAAVCGVLATVGAVGALVVGRESLALVPWILLAFLGAIAGGLALLYRWRIAKLAGLEPTERIAAVVLDEGIVIHGGLVIAWPEIVEVRIGRSPRVRGRGFADAAARSLHASQGVSDMITTLMLGFREWEPIDARATTKAMRRPLMKPVLGLEASATINLSDLPEWQVQEVLAAIVQQAQRHGIPVETF